MGLIKKPTTLIDSTTDTNYIYIETVITAGTSAPATNDEIWEITRITIADGKATKIENGINKGNKVYLAWDQRTTYNPTTRVLNKSWYNISTWSQVNTNIYVR